MGISFLFASLAATIASAPGHTGEGAPTVRPSEAQLCAFAEASPREDRIRPLRVYTRRKTNDITEVTACMTAPNRERRHVYVGFVLFEGRLHGWGEDGQAACIRSDDIARPQCRDSKFVTTTAVRRCRFSTEQPNIPICNIQPGRIDQVVVMVNWRDCAELSETACPSSKNRQDMYLVPSVELP